MRVDNERFARLLAGHQFFAAFEARDLSELASLARVRKCTKGQTIFLKGDPGDSLMAVLSGRVKVSVVWALALAPFASSATVSVRATKIGKTCPVLFMIGFI